MTTKNPVSYVQWKCQLLAMRQRVVEDKELLRRRYVSVSDARDGAPPVQKLKLNESPTISNVLSLSLFLSLSLSLSRSRSLSLSLSLSLRISPYACTVDRLGPL